MKRLPGNLSICPGRLAAAVSVGFILLLPHAAKGSSCEDQKIEVEAENPDLVGHLCELAPKIRDQLASCGLAQSRELKIEVVQELSHKIGNCLAWYDCDHDVVQLTDPTRFGDVVERGSPYTKLPTEVLLQNALTHELAHALVDQSASYSPVSLIDQEYIAAALELELMDPRWREILVADAPVSLPPKEGLIDIWIYGLEPRKFATNVWHHFSLPENGCSLVGRIMRGEATFSAASR